MRVWLSKTTWTRTVSHLKPAPTILSSSLSIRSHRFLAEECASHFASFLFSPSRSNDSSRARVSGVCDFWWRSAAISQLTVAGDLGRYEEEDLAVGKVLLVGAV
jgi:hypothetical protein